MFEHLVIQFEHTPYPLFSSGALDEKFEDTLKIDVSGRCTHHIVFTHFLLDKLLKMAQPCRPAVCEAHSVPQELEQILNGKAVRL